MESHYANVIIPTPQIIQPRLLVPDIPAISERVQRCQRLVLSYQDTAIYGLAQCFVLVFYCLRACFVKYSHDVAKFYVRMNK